MSKLWTGALAGFFVAMAFGTANAACTATGYMRDSIDLTAALIDPGTVDGQVVDATGCDIGVYYSPGQTGAVRNGTNIFGARYYGVLMNGAESQRCRKRHPRHRAGAFRGRQLRLRHRVRSGFSASLGRPHSRQHHL